MAPRRITSEKIRAQRKKRLIKCVDYLQRKGIIHTYEDISKSTGIKTVTIRGALSPASPYLSENFLECFLSTYGDIFHREWLLEGKQKMLRTHPKIALPNLSHRWERIAYIMEQEKMNVQEFAKALGMNAGSTIYRILSNRVHPLDQTMERIYQAFPKYRLEWILDGKGEILDQEYLDRVERELREGNAEAYKVLNTRVFPIIPDAAAAGSLSGFGDEDPEGFETMTLPVDREYKGNYYIFTVKGASMDDGSVNAIVDGDKLLCREIQRAYWNEGLHYRTWPYFVFVTREEGIIVKAIAEQDLERETIRCRSLNPDYPDIILHLKDILGIFNVVELVGRRLKI